MPYSLFATPLRYRQGERADAQPRSWWQRASYDAPPPTATATLPIPACTPPPAPQTFIGPAPTATPTPPSSFSIPQSSFTPPTATLHSAFTTPPSAFTSPTAIRAAVLSAFQSSQSPITNHQSPTPLLGATALALAERKRRKAEEARQAREAQRKAAARNAAEAAFVQEMQAAVVPQPAQSAADLQAGLQALYEGRKAGEAVPPADSKPWWQKVGEWLQQNVVQPIQQAAKNVVNVVRQSIATGIDTIERAVITAAYNVVQIYEKNLDRKLAYHGPIIPPPQGLNGPLWLQRPTYNIPDSMSRPRWGNVTWPDAIQNQANESYSLSKWQNQFAGTTPNECVTTSTLIAMNMMNDYAQMIAGSVDDMPDRDIKSFTESLDENLLVWGRYRIPKPLGFMLPKQQVPNVLNDYAQALQQKYGVSFDVNFSSGNSVDDLIANLQDGNITLIHGVYEDSALKTDLAGKTIINPPGLIGGMPHTVVLAGYDPNTQEWLLNDPANSGGINRVHHDEFIKWWGRGCLAYDGFSMTTITPNP